MNSCEVVSWQDGLVVVLAGGTTENATLGVTVTHRKAATAAASVCLLVETSVRIVLLRAWFRFQKK